MKNRETQQINRQLAYYLASRVLEGIYVKMHKHHNIAPKFDGFKVGYLLTWGLVMYLFELDKGILNRTMVTSMLFIYKESDEDLKSWKDLVPIDLP